jgi:hypothetical protein
MTKTSMNAADHIKGVIITGNIPCLIYNTFLLFGLAIHLIILKLKVGIAIRPHISPFLPKNAI